MAVDPSAVGLFAASRWQLTHLAVGTNGGWGHMAVGPFGGWDVWRPKYGRLAKMAASADL